MIITIIVALYFGNANQNTAHASNPEVFPTVTPTREPLVIGTAIPQAKSGCRQEEWSVGYHIYLITPGENDTIVSTKCTLSAAKAEAIGASYVANNGYWTYEEHVTIVALSIDGVSYVLGKDMVDFVPLRLEPGNHRIIMTMKRFCNEAEKCPIFIIEQVFTLR